MISSGRGFYKYPFYSKKKNHQMVCLEFHHTYSWSLRYRDHCSFERQTLWHLIFCWAPFPHLPSPNSVFPRQCPQNSWNFLNWNWQPYDEGICKNKWLVYNHLWSVIFHGSGGLVCLHTSQQVWQQFPVYLVLKERVIFIPTPGLPASVCFYLRSGQGESKYNDPLK